MWWKVAVGAVAGAVGGYFLTPGYVFWIVAGIILGFLVEVIPGRKRKREVSN